MSLKIISRICVFLRLNQVSVRSFKKNVIMIIIIIVRAIIFIAKFLVTVGLDYSLAFLLL